MLVMYGRAVLTWLQLPLPSARHAVYLPATVLPSFEKIRLEFSRRWRRLQCLDRMSCRCRWLRWAMKPSWNCARYRCLPAMLARCWCGTMDSWRWRGLSSCICSTFTCRCRRPPTAIRTWSHCCLLCLMWLRCVERAIVNKLYRWHLDFKVKYNMNMITILICNAHYVESFLSYKQEIGWKEYLQKWLFCVK